MMDVTHRWNRSFKPLIAGLIISLVLIFAAWLPVSTQAFSHWILTPVVIVLGFFQMLLQCFLFLNLGIESKPRWNTMMFFFMSLVVIIVIGGSMWIMYHLNYNMMMPMDGAH